LTTSDALERRLTDLEVEVPDAGRVSARVLSQARKPQRRQLPRVLGLGVATLLIVSAFLYFVPAADAVLADAPVAGDLLRDAGLVGAGNRVTAVGAVSESSGVRLELVGAYADSTRTVLLIRAHPAIHPLGSKIFDVTLTDQFGRSSFNGSGTSNSMTGDVVATFDALAWPDAITGARITLKVAGVTLACASAAFCNESFSGTYVTGSWTLPAIIGVDEGTVLALPAAGQLGSANFRFTSVIATPATIAVDIEVSGMSMMELGKTVDQSKGKGGPALSVDLIGPDGASYNILGGGGGDVSEGLGSVRLHFWWPRDASSAGDYHLHVAYVGLGEFDRVVHIP
jgi:hypothetical protein